MPQLSYRDFSLSLFFFMWTFFKVLLNLWQYCFCCMFWFFGHEAGGILSPQSEIEPTPPAREGELLTTGSPGMSHTGTLK